LARRSTPPRAPATFGPPPTRYYGCHQRLEEAANSALLAAGGTVFFLLGDSWWRLLTAAYLAVVFTQIAFVGHDAGHRQIFRSRRANNLVGLVHANLLVGVSFGWWVGKHDRHHTNPNHEELDPDIGIAALAFTAAQARGKRGPYRLVARYQAYLLFPLLLEVGHLRVASEADELDFLRSQVLTSRNGRGSRFVDTLLGGLNYQVEHHLSPRCPGPTCATLNPWSGSTACATACPIPKPLARLLRRGPPPPPRGWRPAAPRNGGS
jgi:fatty acid desaturase